ncbi:MAG: TolC family protein [Proteobacteria bacterium]|nr:TolC family protein [Pseudomonadota bacterium]
MKWQMKRNGTEILIKKRMDLIIRIAVLIFLLICTIHHTPSYAQEPSRHDLSANQVGLSEDRPRAEKDVDKYTLSMLIKYAMKNNPRIRIAAKDIEAEIYGIDSARADRMPKIDGGSGITRYRYDTPLTPIVIQPPIGPGTDFPLFRNTIWDAGISFRLPLFRGGRLFRGVNVAEMKKTVVEDNYRMSKQELVYNISSVYHKIAQLEKLLLVNDASVKQLEVHKGNVGIYLKTGVAPRLDLLKTDVELSHAKENRLIVKNSLASAYEFLKNLMGMDDMDVIISIVHEKPTDISYTDLKESMDTALSRRPDYKAAAKKRLISEERVKIAEGRRLPDIFVAGQYGGTAGSDTGFRENWYYGVKLTMPIMDGGSIRSEINREKVQLEKAREEERFLKLTIIREVRDAHMSIANVKERIEVTQKAIESARESLRVELLKYDTGAGMSQDVIDAQTALLRAETDYYQAIFDRETAVAYLSKAIGEDRYAVEVGK